MTVAEKSTIFSKTLLKLPSQTPKTFMRMQRQLASTRVYVSVSHGRRPLPRTRHMAETVDWAEIRPELHDLEIGETAKAVLGRQGLPKRVVTICSWPVAAGVSSPTPTVKIQSEYSVGSGDNLDGIKDIDSADELL